MGDRHVSNYYLVVHHNYILIITYHTHTHPLSTRIDSGQAAGLALATRKPMEINEYHYGTEKLASTIYTSFIVPNGSPLKVGQRNFNLISVV